jgi:hypothetical protein
VGDEREDVLKDQQVGGDLEGAVLPYGTETKES